MTFIPAPAMFVPPMVHPFGAWSLFGARSGYSVTAPSSIDFTGTGASVVCYYPIQVPVTCVARQLFVANGTVASGNIDLGIYADAGYKPGVRLISTGLTAQSGSSTIQLFDITDTGVTPGLCWLGLVASSTGATVFGANTSLAYNALLFFEESSASLPTTATPTEAGSSATVRVFGFSTTTIT